MSKNRLSTRTVTIWSKNSKLGTAEIADDGSWRFPIPVLEPGEHIFRSVTGGVQSASWTVTVVGNEASLEVPHFRNASNAGLNLEEIDYYVYQGDGFVEIPDSGMQPGDTVWVTWSGRNITFDSEIQTVANPPVPLVFLISQYDVIDCIRANVSIHYTVKKKNSEDVRKSVTLGLKVLGHSFDILAPSLSDSHNNLRVYRQTQYNANSTARVRAIGISTWQGEVEYFKDAPYLNFAIDAAWLEENKGKLVLFNWSLRINRDDEKILYSQTLRIDSL